MEREKLSMYVKIRKNGLKIKKHILAIFETGQSQKNRYMFKKKNNTRNGSRNLQVIMWN